MRCIKKIFVALIVSTLTVIESTKFLEQSTVKSSILKTEAVIRNVTNKVFAILKLKRHNSKLKQYLLVNKYFASLTLQDHDCLNKIAKISRASEVKNNESIIFMVAINDLLNDDNKEIEKNKLYNDIEIEKYDDRVLVIIKIFLRRLREAKELHEMNSYMNIDETVLNIIKGTANANTTFEGQIFDHSEKDSESGEIEYWTPSGRRIYKGDRTKIKHYPFMASIQMFNNFQCAGSIIKSDLIITASSCLQLVWNNRFYRENPAYLSVRVGSSFYTGGGEVIPVLEVYFHPGYNPKTLRNNICIMRLTRRIKFRWRDRRRVRKIEIDKHANSLPFNTGRITILGWGAKGQSNVLHDPWQNILSVAALDVYPLKDCQDIYSKEYVTRTNFCAGFISRGGGACNRDIGGPGVVRRKLVGVVSFGSPVCGAMDAPTVFTKLGYYTDWIESIMRQHVPYSKKITTLKPPKSLLPQLDIHTLSKTTTLKIPPVSEKLKPIQGTEVEDVLRIFDNNVFKEFLTTMFDGKEKAEYEELYKGVKNKMDSRTIKNNQEHLIEIESQEMTTPYIEFREPLTQMIEYEEYSDENVEPTTQFDNSNYYTVADDEIYLDTEKVRNTPKELINNIDFKKLIDKGSIKLNKETQVKKNTEFVTDSMDYPLDVNNKKESVLTLLYLSDEQNANNNDIVRSQEDSKGITIVSDSFQDLTRSKSNNVSLINLLPEKELYEILSELIDEEMRYNKTG